MDKTEVNIKIMDRSIISPDKVSPLKRKSSSEPIVTSLGSESKKRRHHRRKPNKKKRQKNFEHASFSSRNSAKPAATSLTKCQHGRMKKQTSCNIWRQKRKFQKPLPNGQTLGGNYHQQHGSNSYGGHQRGPPNAGGGQKLKYLKVSNVVLRPTKVPLLNAPRNSTQFIIDDHESSDLVWNFELKRHESLAKSSQDARPVSADSENSEFVSKIEDEDTFFKEYSERDFQAVYESAHQEEISTWDKNKLVEEIGLLEKKHKELIKHLAKIDPLVYMQKLQRELSRLEDQNRLLKRFSCVAEDAVQSSTEDIPPVEALNSSQVTDVSLPDSTNE